MNFGHLNCQNALCDYKVVPRSTLFVTRINIAWAACLFLLVMSFNILPLHSSSQFANLWLHIYSHWSLQITLFVNLLSISHMQ